MSDEEMVDIDLRLDKETANRLNKMTKAEMRGVIMALSLEKEIAALVDAVEKLRTCPYEPDCSSYDELVRVIFEKNKPLLPQKPRTGWIAGEDDVSYEYVELTPAVKLALDEAGISYE